MQLLQKKIPFNHWQTVRAGGIYPWFGSDSEDVYNRHLVEKYNDLKEANWLDASDAIQYRINQAGFRDDEFDSRDCGIALGCSLTMGVGVPEQLAWPQQLSKRLDIHVWNLGIAGGSNDVCFRILDHYIDILRPRFVIYQMPSSFRSEFFLDSRWRQTMATHFGDIPQEYLPYLKNWYTNEENVQAQFRRNLLAIKYRCHETQTPLFITQQQMIMDRKGRDLTHPGIDSLTQFTEYIHEQKHHYFP